MQQMISLSTKMGILCRQPMQAGKIRVIIKPMARVVVETAHSIRVSIFHKTHKKGACITDEKNCRHSHSSKTSGARKYAAKQTLVAQRWKSLKNTCRTSTTEELIQETTVIKELLVTTLKPFQSIEVLRRPHKHKRMSSVVFSIQKNKCFECESYKDLGKASTNNIVGE